ncbi:MAG: Gfo/Idh/MocA family oxidoreductase [Planctomycetales bacterium]|nr:Gfo/Idh/MocA family oxidoreductase [Planctomycetales bacterium]
MAKVRVAVIGDTQRGRYGHGLDTCWLQVPECEIVGVADPDEAGRAAAAKRLSAPQAFADYRQMLDKTRPEVVAIGMRWLDRHRDIALQLARRGIHVYCEKPMCRTLAEADEIIAACEQHGTKFALAHQTRYSPKLQVVRDMIEDGLLGEILELRGRGKEDRRGGGEDLWVLGSHVMNLMHFFGGEPSWCFASVLKGDAPIAKQDVAEGNEGIGPLAGDNLAAMYGMDDGAFGYFATRRDAAGGRFGLTLHGSKGKVEILTGFLPSVQFLPDPSWSPGRSGKSWVPVSSAGVGKPEPMKDESHSAGNVLACLDLLAAIREDRQPECSMYEGRVTVEMIAAVFESQRLSAPVTLPLKNRDNPLRQL